jgi:uncharacterized protein YuzE
MEFQLDRDVNALYIKLRSGNVSRTIELTDSVYVDLDAQDNPLGIEFVNADEFLPFLRDHRRRRDSSASARAVPGHRGLNLLRTDQS